MNFKNIDWLLVVSIITLNIFGIFVLYGAGELGHIFAYQTCMRMFFGIGVLFIFYTIDYHRLVSLAPIIYIVAIFLLILILLPFFGTKIKGARSWFRFAGFGFQPAELIKIAIVLLLTNFLVSKNLSVKSVKELLFPSIIVFIPISLIMVQPDLGYALFLIPLSLLLLFIGGANIILFVTIFFIGFLTIFIPLYIEYHKYMLIEPLLVLLQDTSIRLYEAVKVLGFDLWSILELHSDKLVFKTSLANNQWVIKTLLQEENYEIISKSVEVVRSQKPTFLRDFFYKPWLVFGTVLFFVFGYITTLLVAFFFRENNKTYFIRYTCLILSLGLTLGYLGSIFIDLRPHQVSRVVSFVNPEQFSKGAGYQLRHSLITLGSGQFFGKGFTKGDMTKGDVAFLPEWYNDFIFSTLGEQFGFVGTGFILLIYLFVLLRSIFIALHAKDDVGSLLAIGIVSIFFLHVFLNVAIISGLMPVTGLPLPFLSHGGSNLLISYLCIGILLNINRQRFINVAS